MWSPLRAQHAQCRVHAATATLTSKPTAFTTKAAATALSSAAVTIATAAHAAEPLPASTIASTPFPTT